MPEVGGYGERWSGGGFWVSAQDLRGDRVDNMSRMLKRGSRDCIHDVFLYVRTRLLGS